MERTSMTQAEVTKEFRRVRNELGNDRDAAAHMARLVIKDRVCTFGQAFAAAQIVAAENRGKS